MYSHTRAHTHTQHMRDDVLGGQAGSSACSSTPAESFRSGPENTFLLLKDKKKKRWFHVILDMFAMEQDIPTVDMISILYSPCREIAKLGGKDVVFLAIFFSL